MRIARSSFAVCLAATLIGGSCSHQIDRAGQLPVVADYDQVDSHLDRPIRVRGYYGAHHEATGLYFSRGDLRSADQCVAITNGSFAHGQRIDLVGTLHRGQCGKDVICLTVCQPFEFTPGERVES